MIRLITDVCGKHHTVEAFLRQEVVCVAPLYDRIGDRAMQAGRAFVLAKITLERFEVQTVQELLNALRAAGAPRYCCLLSHGKIVDFAELAKETKGGYQLVAVKEYTGDEKIWMELANYSGYRFRFVRDSAQFRTIRLGLSDVAHAWTDAETYIAINRDFLCDRRFTNLQHLFEIGALLLHEYCHDQANLDTDVHGTEFKEAFYENVHFIGSYVVDAIKRLPRVLARHGRDKTKALVKLQDTVGQTADGEFGHFDEKVAAVLKTQAERKKERAERKARYADLYRDR